MVDVTGEVDGRLVHMLKRRLAGNVKYVEWDIILRAEGN